MSDDLELWQQTLATEHAAIWGYGLVGATPPLATPAGAAADAHRSRRARCVDAVVALGGDPVTSAGGVRAGAPAERSRSQTPRRRPRAELLGRLRSALRC